MLNLLETGAGGDQAQPEGKMSRGESTGHRWDIEQVQASTRSLRWYYPDQVEGPPHIAVAISARLNRAPLADDKK